MQATSTASDQAPLNYQNRAAIEQSALKRLSGQGSYECCQILQNWFPRLLKRLAERMGADADALDYKVEVEEILDILECIRSGLTANERPNSGPHRSAL